MQISLRTADKGQAKKGVNHGVNHCRPNAAFRNEGAFRFGGAEGPAYSSREQGNDMRIAQVAPLSESVPPKHYRGTERTVPHPTDELVRQGHDATLCASGGSVSVAR